MNRLINLSKSPLIPIYLFAFLGPLGNIFCPSFFPYQFRLFYLVLPFFVLFFTKIYYRELRTLLIFAPFLLYSLASAYFCINRPALHYETSLLNRVFLFVCEALFMFGAAFYLRDRPSTLEKNRLIRLYLYGFFISLFVGYALFIGYYLRVIPLSFVDKFTIITQFGWGLLRFSPGSYANEYGIVSSFAASVLLLLIAERKHPDFQIGFSKKTLYFFFLLTFFGLLLTTTRAAYISFLLAIIYIFCVSKTFRLILTVSTIVTAFFFIIFREKLGFVMTVLLSAFTPTGYLGHSITMRFDHWAESFQAFSDFPLLGRGFGALFYIHNVYLEIFSELGVLGCLTLVAFGLAYWLNHSKTIKKIFFKRWASEKELFSNRVIVLGLIHVFWFAATNHNMNHHLTWMVFLLFNINLFTRKKETADTSLQQAL